MARHKKRLFLWILIPIITVGILGLFSIHYFLDPDLYRNILRESLAAALGREVSMGKAKISVWDGLGIAFEDFQIKDRSQNREVLRSKKLILKVKLLPLLKREIKWKRVVFESPFLRLHRDKHGKFNLFDGVLTQEGRKSSEQEIIQTLATLFGGSFTLRDGEISFADETFGESPLITEIRSFNLQFSKVSYEKPFSFHINGIIDHSKKEGRFSISGTIQNLPEDMDLAKGRMEAEVKTKGIEISHFWPYLAGSLPMKAISGTLDVDARYEGSISGAFKTSAKIKFKDVVYDHPQVFAQILTPKWVNLDLDMSYDFKDIHVSHLSLQLPEIGVRVKGKIYGIGTEGMGMEAVAESSPFDLSDAKKLIPYRVITPDVSDALFRAEGNGPLQIVSVNLSGRMAEIDHCDLLANAHTLSVELKLNGVRLKFPWNLPPLEDLKGSLIFKDGHLNLNNLTGRAFHSSLEKVNGRFHQLLVFPTLEAQWNGRLDLTDLPSLLRTDLITGEFADVLSSVTVQSGRAEYQLSIKGVVKPPYLFQHQEVYRLSSVRFKHRQIPFPVLIGEGRIELSNEDLQWTEAKVEFGNCSLVTNGSRRQEKRLSSLEITARGRVDVKNLMTLSQSPLFPKEIRAKAKGFEGLSGTGQISFKGKSLTKPPSFSFEGEFAPREVSFLQEGISSPLVFKEGSLSFSNLGVGFSRVKLQLYNSFLSLDGSLKEGNVRLSAGGSIDLKFLPSLLRLPFFPDQVQTQMEGVQELVGEAGVQLRWLGGTENWFRSLKEGEVRLKGVSLRHRAFPLPLSQIEGTLFLSPEQFRFVGLKGKMGDSQVMLSGGFPRPFLEERATSTTSSSQSLKSGEARPPGSAARWISFQVSSPEIDLNPFLPKRTDSSRTSFAEVSDWLAHWKIEGKVEADQVKYRGLSFGEFKVGMKTVDGKLLLHPLQFKGMEGDVWGEGWIEPVERGIRFEIKPRISNMEAKAFLRTLLQKGEEEKMMLSGRIHIDKVELRGEGEDSQRVKESLNGKLSLEVEDGVIERFNILSKIFSILNVYQILQGRFPDLRTKGLPFHQTTANIHVKNGIVSTDDFLVDSDAMKITLVGKVDLSKKQIDARIGVHPLVTLDTVLSKVPIAGYILTGKDKAFLSFIYEVRGDLDDPKIEAVPIKGMGEGLWGIIKRLLETPLRPFQKPPVPNKEKE